MELTPNVTPSLGNGAATGAALSSGAAAVGSEAIELAIWQSVETTEDTAEYQAYLDRYPNGTFAPLASTRVADPSTSVASEPESHQVELAFWDSVTDSDDPEMFEAYLTKYPDGEFKSLAEIRIRSLGNADTFDRRPDAHELGDPVHSRRKRDARS